MFFVFALFWLFYGSDAEQPNELVHWFISSVVRPVKVDGYSSEKKFSNPTPLEK